MELLLVGSYRNIPVNLLAFVCDAPARSFLKCIISHGGYYACERCTVRGIQNRGVRYIDTTSPLRTNEEFAREHYDIHQHKLSPLSRLQFPMVSGFILDSMHLVFLGVVKK